MQHARKFVLVPSDTLARMTAQKHQPNMYKNQTEKLEHGMSGILGRTDIPDDQKVLMYNQQQQRYLINKKMVDQPIKFAIYNEEQPQQDHPLQQLQPQQAQQFKSLDVLHSAVNSFQHKHPRRAAQLGQFLNSIGSLQWNNRGEIIINGQMINGSSLTSLMEDILIRGPSRDPVGGYEFARLMIENNLPIELVGETSGKYIGGAFGPALHSPQGSWLSGSSDHRPFRGFPPQTPQDFLKSPLLTPEDFLSVDSPSSVSTASTVRPRNSTPASRKLRSSRNHAQEEERTEEAMDPTPSRYTQRRRKSKGHLTPQWGQSQTPQRWEEY